MKTPARNEIGRIAIRDIFTQNGPNAYENGQRLWAFREQGHDWKMVEANFQQAYSLIGRICSTRAIDAENGDIVCDGKSVRAEDYLGLWRTAEQNAISNESLLGMGGHILVTIRRPYDAFVAGSNVANEPAKCQETLESTSCQIEGDTAVWRIKFDGIGAIGLYERVRSVWVKGSYEPSLDNCITAGVYLPEGFATQASGLLATRSLFELEAA